MLNLTKLIGLYDTINQAYDRRIELAENRNYGKESALANKTVWQLKFCNKLVACFDLESLIKDLTNE